MMRPASWRWTPSGLTRTRVRSVTEQIPLRTVACDGECSGSPREAPGEAQSQRIGGSSGLSGSAGGSDSAGAAAALGFADSAAGADSAGAAGASGAVSGVTILGAPRALATDI